MGQGDELSAEQLVDGCLDLVGPMTIAEETRQQLVGHVSRGGGLRHATESERDDFATSRRRDFPDDRHHFRVPIRLKPRKEWERSG